MSRADYIKTETADSYFELMEIIQNEGTDLRDKFIFRGVENYDYSLVPSALRVKNNKLDNFIGKDFVNRTYVPVVDALEMGLVKKDEIPFFAENVVIVQDKDGKVKTIDNENIMYDDGTLQVKKELYILLKFLNFADRSGLKVTDDYEVRSNINNYVKYVPRCWPEEKFIEVMSLAQHYGLPTQVLDWSYDYKSSLYFAIKDILDSPLNTDGAIWAFNYKIFEKRNVSKYNPVFHQLRFYRPEYIHNPNLQAQKGLFSFVIDDIHNPSSKSLEDRIIDELDGESNNSIEHWCGDKIPRIADIQLPVDEFLFYKIKIPKNKKQLFLKALYADGYSEEFLFPGYAGAILAMENQVKLENLL